MQRWKKKECTSLISGIATGMGAKTSTASAAGAAAGTTILLLAHRVTFFTCEGEFGRSLLNAQRLDNGVIMGCMLGLEAICLSFLTTPYRSPTFYNPQAL